MVRTREDLPYVQSGHQAGSCQIVWRRSNQSASDSLLASACTWPCVRHIMDHSATHVPSHVSHVSHVNERLPMHA